jgi:hypothetical protein
MHRKNSRPPPPPSKSWFFLRLAKSRRTDPSSSFVSAYGRKALVSNGIALPYNNKASLCSKDCMIFIYRFYTMRLLSEQAAAKLYHLEFSGTVCVMSWRILSSLATENTDFSCNFPVIKLGRCPVLVWAAMPTVPSDSVVLPSSSSEQDNTSIRSRSLPLRSVQFIVHRSYCCTLYSIFVESFVIIKNRTFGGMNRDRTRHLAAKCLALENV